jgi:membrane protein
MSGKMKTRTARISDFIWGDDLRELSGLHRLTVFVLRVFHVLLRELLGGQLSLHAMGLVYTTLLSIVPLLAVSFSVLKGFGYHHQLETYLFDILLEPLGSSGTDIANTIMGFVDNVKVGMLGSVGFALLIYTVVALVQKIEAAFNFVWQIERLRSLSQRFSNYLSVITIGPVLMFGAIGVAAAMLNTDIALRLAATESIGTMLVYAGKLLPYVLVCLAFTFIYILMPNTRVRPGAALVGGVMAGVIWKVTGWGFAAFIASSAKYAAIYSSFAILILLLIWLYLSWLILLVGSQIAYFVQNPKFMTLHRVSFVLSNRMREQLAFQIMYLVAYHHHHDLPAWSQQQLIDFIGLPDEPVNRVLQFLMDAGFLTEVERQGSNEYLPSHAAETVALEDLLEVVRRAGESRFLNLEQVTSNTRISELMGTVGTGCRSGLGGQTLADLIEPVDADLERVRS